MDLSQDWPKDVQYNEEDWERENISSEDDAGL